MLTWAGIVGGVFAILWLMTWVVQLAAYAMFALAWAGWLALRVVGVLAMGLFAIGWAVCGPEPHRTKLRAAFAGGWRQRQPAGLRPNSASMRRTHALVAG